MLPVGFQKMIILRSKQPLSESQQSHARSAQFGAICFRLVLACCGFTTTGEKNMWSKVSDVLAMLDQDPSSRYQGVTKMKHQWSADVGFFTTPDLECLPED